MLTTSVPPAFRCIFVGTHADRSQVSPFFNEYNALKYYRNIFVQSKYMKNMKH